MATRICLLPLDSRPVCYDLPQSLIASAGLEAALPTRNLLGQLKQPANLTALQRWWNLHLADSDPAIVALDTVAYGGLIPSRVGHETVEQLQERIQEFFKAIHPSPLFGFSSILRIPNYNVADEEPPYWAQFGKALHQYSVKAHKQNRGSNHKDPDVPQSVMDDFINRRQRNYTINRDYIDQLALGPMDFLVYAQDDTGRHGLNVQEANALKARIKRKKQTHRSMVLTGSDEIASCLIARYMGIQRKEPVRIYPFYSSEAGRKLEARFDGIAIEEVVAQRAELCGAILVEAPEEADLWMLVHTPHKRQGDHCSGIAAQTESYQIEQVLNVVSRAFRYNRHLMLADVAYANGSDPQLSLGLINQFQDLTPLYGYAGWNTPGNTIGTAMAMGVVRLLAEEQERFQPKIFNEALFTRFADDWLYQADVRQQLRRGTAFGEDVTPNEVELNLAMSDGLGMLKRRFAMDHHTVHCSFPCNRTFEVAIEIKAPVAKTSPDDSEANHPTADPQTSEAKGQTASKTEDPAEGKTEDKTTSRRKKKSGPSNPKDPKKAENTDETDPGEPSDTPTLMTEDEQPRALV